MIKTIDEILTAEEFSREDIIQLLSCDEKEGQGKLLKKAYEVKEKHKGKKVWLRGLIEYSNRCRKNCLYCGIGCNNSKVKRYVIPDDEVFNAVDFAYKNKYGSIVLQSGERNDKEFIDHIDYLLKEIKLPKGIILFSGFSRNEIRENPIREKCLQYIDVLIDGRYEKNLKVDFSLRGSSNQEFYFFSNN